MSGQDDLEAVKRYRELVLAYEALDEEIDEYIKARGGGSAAEGVDEMSPDEIVHYRDLSRRRDDLLNEMRILEQELHLNEDDDSASADG